MAPLEDMGLTWVWFAEVTPMQGGLHHYYHEAKYEKRKLDPMQAGVWSSLGLDWLLTQNLQILDFL